MFKNAVIFRIQPNSVLPAVEALEGSLDLNRFVACGPTQRQSSGWVEPRGVDHGPLVENVVGELVLKLMVESRVLPASVVKDMLEERIKKIKEETGRERIGSREKKDLKEAIEHELLPRAFTKKGATRLWLSRKAGVVVVDVGSIKKADGIVSALCEAVSQAGGQLNLDLLRTLESPSVAMARWLTTQEAPAEFTVDRDCELKSEGDNACVRYASHNLEIAEVVEHIKVQGKVPTKLAMTHDSRVSFVLAHDLTIKKIDVLDVDLSSSDAPKGEESDFDANVTLFAGEMTNLLPNLINALGGELISERGGDGAAANDDDIPAQSEALAA